MKPKSVQSQKPFVVISLSTLELTTRNMLRGVLSYVRANQHLLCRFCLGRPDDELLEECLSSKCIGLVTDRWSPTIARKVRTYDIPTIGFNLTPVPHRLVGAVSSLHEEIGRLAASHLAGLGVTSFGYVPVPRKMWWCRERRKCFIAELAKMGRKCNVFRGGDLVKWLVSLDKPCAVFASTDIMAREVVDACRSADLSVPSDVSVMGVDNDELVCETSEPGLTSIEWNTEDIGYAAAALLDRAIRGEVKRGSGPEMFFYVGARLVSRASTFVNFTRDPLVEKCRSVIRGDLSRKLTSTILAEELGVTKRTLERRFLAGTGRTIHTEVLSARIDAAKKLIDEKHLSLDAIASACGFYDVSHLCRTLKRPGRGDGRRAT